jgi:hypothetical protein
MMAQLQQELAEKEEALERLQAVVQEHQEARPPSIATSQSQHHDETTLVSSPSLDFLKSILVNLKIIPEALVPSS